MTEQREHGPALEPTPEVLKENCLKLLTVTVDLKQALLMVGQDGLDLKQPAQRTTAEIFDDAYDMLDATTCQTVLCVTPLPRKPSKQDRVNFRTGEHKGIQVHYNTAVGNRLTINEYGGLRDPHAPNDMKDNDIFAKRHHARRTELIVSTPTHLNLHIIDTEGDKVLDMWTVCGQNHFRLTNLRFGEEHVPLPRCEINSDHTVFDELSSRFTHATNDLLDVIPSE